MEKSELQEVVIKNVNGLKDFQRATVERVDELFRMGRRRVLVADEVGMGKTLIARGVIAKTALLRFEEQDKLFRVVYICSNVNIANQNISKLKASKTARIENISDTRLSMQHLLIRRQESDLNLQKEYVQLIPLTPGTSFKMTGGGGIVQERALIYAVLKRVFKEKSFDISQYEDFFIGKAENAWKNWARDCYEKQVDDCDKMTKEDYLYKLKLAIWKYDKDTHILTQLKEYLCQSKRRQSEYINGNLSEDRDNAMLHKLRVMFAKISASMLEPDLVIMDEFQRFKYLLGSEKDSDMDILANQFLKNENTRVLLLSATPYKLYSTLDEIEELGEDEHYREFFQLMDFLFTDKSKKFRKVWEGYHVALSELKAGNTDILQIKKKAEDVMYEGVCRTERNSVMESGDFLDDSKVKKPLVINENDIRSYLVMGKLLKAVQSSMSLTPDYIKSCPFLLSFMKNYKLQRIIEHNLQSNPDKIDEKMNNLRLGIKLSKGMKPQDLLWVDSKKVNEYEELPETNARLTELKKWAFENHAELYLWIPPSRPYYDLQGPYKHGRHFSKILVFSSWEMVPRMIGALISYEAERLTVGAVCKAYKNETKNGNESSDKDLGSISYFAKKRYPSARLQLRKRYDQPQTMWMFCLLYPSKTLSNMYDPIKGLNEKYCLSDIERNIRGEIRSQLDTIGQKYVKDNSGQEDSKWYYLAPMLMDGAEYARSWVDMVKTDSNDIAAGKNRSVDGISVFDSHLNYLLELLKSEDTLMLGRMPKNLAEVLTNMSIASPAVCIYRINGGNGQYATELARVFLGYFNTTESTAVIQLASQKYHAKRSDNNNFWQDVLVYCKDGCFQAMFDEYYHLVDEAVSFSGVDEKEKNIQDTMLTELRIPTASYDVDNYKNFKQRIENNSQKGRNGQKQVSRGKMRAHYAVALVNNDGDDQGNVLRMDSVRRVFNSPLRPFVLASTSIGQEGLDFHNYCRRIMHWNLPSNPIDLEQREGRINRFKCLSIRQNIADVYGGIDFKTDVWAEMFQEAKKRSMGSLSDLVPYWCFGKNQSVKIERIVPMYPLSRDEIRYDRLIKILSLYRLTLGQARQEELLEYLFQEIKNTDELKDLYINLSPFFRKMK